MAKNEAHERAAFQAAPSQDVRVQRFDTHFLLNGVWYITAVCATCGLVDEEVLWTEAKTPHHAGTIADLRHAACAVINDAHEMYLTGLDEIRAAEGLCASQARNLEAAIKEVKKWEVAVEADKKNITLHRMLEQAIQQRRRHERGMIEATKRLENTRKDNEA